MQPPTYCPPAIIAPANIEVSRAAWTHLNKLANTYRIPPEQFLTEFLEIVAKCPPYVLMECIQEAARATDIYNGRIATIARL